MKKFRVSVSELRYGFVYVDAESEDEAVESAKKEYENGGRNIEWHESEMTDCSDPCEISENESTQNKAKQMQDQIHEVIVTIKDGGLSGVYSDLELLGVELIDFDCTDPKELEEADKAWIDTKKRIDNGLLYSHW